MAEVAETTLEQSRAAADLDAKLRAEAARKHAAIQQRSAATGNVGVLVERVMAGATSSAAPRREPWEPEPSVLSVDRLSNGVKEQVPERFRKASLENFRTETDGQRNGREFVEKWIGRAQSKGGAMLALIGPVGCGKSHLLYAAANALIASETRFYARPWYRLADELRYGGPSAFVPTLRDEPHEVRSRLFAQHIVLLDEVRRTAGTDFDDMELVKFVCHAYDKGLSVMVTTNVFPLADVMGPAAASRFKQVMMDGRDARQTP